MMPYDFKRKLTVQKDASIEKFPSGRDLLATSDMLGNSSSTLHQFASRSVPDGKRSNSTKRSLTTPVPEYLERKTLGIREWILVIVEIIATYGTHIVRRRKSSPDEALRLWKTKRDLEISLHFIHGWAAIGSMVAAIIADCYVGPHALVLCNIWVNFIATSIFYIEEVVKRRIITNPYAEVVSNITSVAFIILKSTDFSRIVFALENFRSRKELARILLFVLVLIGDRPRNGGLLWLFTSYLDFSPYTQVGISFYTAGVSLILFHLVPRSTDEREFSYIARRVVQSVALSTLRLLRLNRPDTNPLGYKLSDRQTTTATKDLFILFALILPTIGYFLYLTGMLSEGHLWEAFRSFGYPSGFYKFTGINIGLQIVTYSTMIVSFFVLRPLSVFVGIKHKFSHQFVVGYLVSLLVCWCATGFAKVYEPPGSLSGAGHVRVLNTREEEVRIFTDDNKLSRRNFTIKPHEAIMLSLPVYDNALVRTTFVFNELEQFSTHLEVALKKCAAYVLVDPSELLRIDGYIPIWMGVPEAYDPEKARFYVFTGARSFVDMKFTLEDLDTREVLKDGPLTPGETFVFEVPPGKYKASLQRYNVEEKLDVGPGSVSGLIFYSDYHSGKLIVDEALKGQVASSFLITSFGLGFGFSLIFAYIPLVLMAFGRAPHGLVTTAFGYLAFQEYLTYWILLIGFYTWHDQITSHVLMLYVFSISFLFFCCIFVYMKYTNL